MRIADLAGFGGFEKTLVTRATGDCLRRETLDKTASAATFTEGTFHALLGTQTGRIDALEIGRSCGHEDAGKIFRDLAHRLLHVFQCNRILAGPTICGITEKGHHHQLGRIIIACEHGFEGRFVSLAELIFGTLANLDIFPVLTLGQSVSAGVHAPSLVNIADCPLAPSGFCNPGMQRCGANTNRCDGPAAQFFQTLSLGLVRLANGFQAIEKFQKIGAGTKRDLGIADNNDVG